MFGGILFGKEELKSKIKGWGVEGEKYKTSLSPHLQILLHFSLQHEKKRGKRTENRDHTGNIHSFRKQFYVSYM